MLFSSQESLTSVTGEKHATLRNTSAKLDAWASHRSLWHCSAAQHMQGFHCPHLSPHTHQLHVHQAPFVLGPPKTMSILSVCVSPDSITNDQGSERESQRKVQRRLRVESSSMVGSIAEGCRPHIMNASYTTHPVPSGQRATHTPALNTAVHRPPGSHLPEPPGID